MHWLLSKEAMGTSLLKVTWEIGAGPSGSRYWKYFLTEDQLRFPNRGPELIR